MYAATFSWMIGRPMKSECLVDIDLYYQEARASPTLKIITRQTIIHRRLRIVSGCERATCRLRLDHTDRGVNNKYKERKRNRKG